MYLQKEEQRDKHYFVLLTLFRLAAVYEYEKKYYFVHKKIKQNRIDEKIKKKK